ncbi:MAG: hypothetical protein DBX52_07610 [Clostridiales bacterium]|nr:MAG: hypothetical protein DBX52_07610 [Clostridiales bacterium]
MGFLKKKKEAEANLALLRRLHGRSIAYFSERSPAAMEERILGREGAFSVQDEQLIISCGNQVLFRHPLREIKAYELMNLSGVCLHAGGRRFTAYYTNGKLGKK